MIDDHEAGVRFYLPACLQTIEWYKVMLPNNQNYWETI